MTKSKHVRDRLAAKIQAGVWGPGQAIPSEIEIAREFRVAPGTVRAAITALVNENLVVRKHGVGTFVYEFTQDEEMARFHRLFDAKRVRIHPVGQMKRPTRAVASRTECRELSLPEGSKVFRIRYVRERNGAPFSQESISLPEALFPGLGDRQHLGDSLYEMYQSRYRVLVTEVEERLHPVRAEGSAVSDLRSRRARRCCGSSVWPSDLAESRSNGGSASAISPMPATSRASNSRSALGLAPVSRWRGCSVRH